MKFMSRSSPMKWNPPQARPGLVRIRKVTNVLSRHPFIQSLRAFPGPLSKKIPAEDIDRFLRIKLAEVDADATPSSSQVVALSATSPMADPSSSDTHLIARHAHTRLLWQVLLTMCRHEFGLGTIDAKKDSVRADDRLDTALLRLLLRAPDGSDEAMRGAVGQSPMAAAPLSPYCASGWGDVHNPTTTMQPMRTPLPPAQLERVVQEIESRVLSGQRDDAVRLAVEHELWGHAVLLASSASQQDMQTYRTIVSQFAMASLREGSPLQSLYLLLGGNPAQLFRGLTHAQPHGTLPQHGGGGGQPAAVPPLNMEPTGIIASWRKNLAMLIANPTSHDRSVVQQLGDMLWSRYGQVEAAHVCYLIADEPPELTVSGRVVLVGVDHRNCPRTFFSDISAMQRTELLEYAKSNHVAAWVTAGSPGSSWAPHSSWQAAFASGTGVLSPQMQIFKYVYACWLVDVGETTLALAYIEHLQAIIKAVEKKKLKLTGGDFLTTALSVLEDRLRQHMNLQKSVGVGAAVVSSVFGLFDRGINFLINGSTSSTTKKAPGPHSPLITAIPTAAMAAPPLTSLAPAAVRGMQPLALPTQQAQPQNMHMQAQQQHMPPAQQQQQQPQQSPPPQQQQQQPQPPPAAGGGGGGGGVLSGVGSFLGSMFGSAPVRQVNLEEHQGAEHYYDQARGRWVERGKEHEADEEPVAPPPPPPRPMTGYKPPAPLATAPPTLITTPLRPSAGGAGAAPTRPGMPTMMPMRAGGVPTAAPMAATARYAVSTAVPTAAAPSHPTGFAMPLARPSPARGYAGKVFVPTPGGGHTSDSSAAQPPL